jgi:hypothetical protein
LEKKNLWITELAITYNDGRPINAVGIMELRDGKIAHETHYYADPFEPPVAISVGRENTMICEECI